jgi:hypothetical protein
MFEAPGKYGQRPSLQKVRRGLHAATLMACSLSMSPAFAEEAPSAEETAAARALALEGLKLADAGRCDEAIQRLARAEKLHHAPVVLGRLGECQVTRGRLVEGTETLRKVLREALPPDPPEVLLKARERAQAVLDKTKGRIGALNIVVRGPEDMSLVVVMVDGEPMNAALLDVDRPTDPGEHLVEARAPGFSSASSHVSVDPGGRQNVVIDLVVDPNAPVPAPSTGGPLTKERSEPSSATSAAPDANASDGRNTRAATTPDNEAPEEPNHAAAYVTWATGGVALLAGSVLGVMALNRKNDLADECPGNLCPASARDRLDSAKGIGTAATVSFIIGGAAAGLGTFLYVTAHSPSESSEQSAAAKPAALRARPWIGVGSVGLSGEF